MTEHSTDVFQRRRSGASAKQNNRSKVADRQPHRPKGIQREALLESLRLLFCPMGDDLKPELATFVTAVVALATEVRGDPQHVGLTTGSCIGGPGFPKQWRSWISQSFRDESIFVADLARADRRRGTCVSLQGKITAVNEHLDYQDLR
jgi:hypothetical protein